MFVPFMSPSLQTPRAKGNGGTLCAEVRLATPPERSALEEGAARGAPGRLLRPLVGELEGEEAGFIGPVGLCGIEAALDPFPHPGLAPDLVLPHARVHTRWRRSSLICELAVADFVEPVRQGLADRPGPVLEADAGLTRARDC